MSTGASRHSGVRWLNPVERRKGETEEREKRGGPAPKTYVSKGSYWLGGSGARAYVGFKRETRTVELLALAMFPPFLGHTHRVSLASW